MKAIYRIAKLELYLLFYSPVAWLVMTIFTIQTGIKFTSLLDSYQKGQFLGRQYEHLTSVIFSGNGYGFFPSIQAYLYLYIPLFTMGLLSRETSSGSIKLPLSSPVRTMDIVLGKFLSMLLFGLALIGILMVYVLVASYAMPNMDWAMVLSGLLGIYLLICAYAAIGLFMSSLTSYQVVAAISTLILLAALNYVGLVFQRIDFIRDITYFLSIAGRTDNFVNGLMISKDIMYFVVVISLFLGMTYLKLKSATESRSKWAVTLRYLALVVGLLLIGYISARPKLTLYADVTRDAQNTLTKNSQEVIARMHDHPLKITTYVNLLDAYHYFYAMPEARNTDLARFERYRRFLPDMQLDYVYYWDHGPSRTIYKRNPGLNDEQLAKKIARSADLNFKMFMPPAEMKKRIDLKDEDFTLIRQIDYNGKKTFLRVFADQTIFPEEKEITAALKRLVVQVPKVAFLTGNNERSIERRGDKDLEVSTIHKNFRYALINQGFDIVTCDIQRQQIPDSICALVISDPREPFTADALGKINTYIQNGGNVFIAAEPGANTVLAPILNSLGVSLTNGQLVQQSKDFAPDLIVTGFAKAAPVVSPSFAQMIDEGARLTFPGTAALNYTDSAGFKVTPFILSDPSVSWNTIRQINPDDTSVAFQPDKGDTKGVFPIALALSRNIHNRQQKILVTGDADFMSNAELNRNNIITSNFSLTTGIFSWFSDGTFPIDTYRPPSKDNKVLFTMEAISRLRIFFVGIFPAILVFFAAFLLIRRKRR